MKSFTITFIPADPKLDRLTTQVETETISDVRREICNEFRRDNGLIEMKRNHFMRADLFDGFIIQEN